MKVLMMMNIIVGEFKKTINSKLCAFIQEHVETMTQKFISFYPPMDAWRNLDKCQKMNPTYIQLNEMNWNYVKIL